MKPAPFDYARPRNIPAALNLLASADSVKVLAGGQSLGPMLNLRLAQPSLLVDVRCIPELHAVSVSDDAVVFGSCVTHAMIEDGVAADPSGGLMREVAANIAYRAVRNRGTIGGSVCHADPAADWVNTLPVLSAVALIVGPQGRREVAIEHFMTGAFATVLGDDEILLGIRVPKVSKSARWGHYKFCRKPGEFAEAVAAVLIDSERAVCRAVIGALQGAPHVIADARFLLERFDETQARAAIDAAGLGDNPYDKQVHYAALKRAVSQLR